MPSLRDVTDALANLGTLRSRSSELRRTIERNSSELRQIESLLPEIERVNHIEQGIPLVEQHHQTRSEIWQAGSEVERRADVYADARAPGLWSTIGYWRSYEAATAGWRQRQLIEQVGREEALSAARAHVCGGRAAAGLRASGRANRVDPELIKALVHDVESVHRAAGWRVVVYTIPGRRYTAICLQPSLSVPAVPLGPPVTYAVVDLVTGDILSIEPSGSFGEPVGNLLAGDPSYGRAALRPGQLAYLRQMEPAARIMARALRKRRDDERRRF